VGTDQGESGGAGAETGGGAGAVGASAGRGASGGTDGMVDEIPLVAEVLNKRGVTSFSRIRMSRHVPKVLADLKT